MSGALFGVRLGFHGGGKAPVDPVEELETKVSELTLKVERYRQIAEHLIERFNPPIYAPSSDGLSLHAQALTIGDREFTQWLEGKGKAEFERLQLKQKQQIEEGLYDKIVLAAGEGRLDDVKTLVEAGVALTVKNSSGRYVFQEAAEKGQTAVVQYLLDQGVSFKDLIPSPLHLACVSNKDEVVSLLVARGAQADAFTFQRMCERGLTQALRACSKAGFSQERVVCGINHALRNDHADTFEFFLDLKVVTIDSKFNESNTLLHLAAIRKAKSIAALLLIKKINIQARNSSGKTARDIALKNGCPEIVADIDAYLSQELRPAARSDSELVPLLSINADEDTI